MAKKGNFIEYVVSDDPNKYPNGGEQNGYYYDVFDGSGLYVWKKYDKREFRTVVNTIPTGFTLSLFNQGDSDHVGDFSFVDEDYLIGTVINLNVENTEDVTLTLLPNNKVDCQSASIDSWSYSKTTKTITFSSSDIYGESIILLSKGANFNHFLSYVTAEDISKYPDGAVYTDGYWYEKVVDGVPLGLLGCTKYAVDTFTSSSRSLLNKTDIPHSLGAKPKIIILTAIDFTSTTNSDVEKVGIFNLSDVSQGGQIIYYNSSATNMRSSASLGFGLLSDSSITVGGSSYYYPAGQVYKLITMA